MNLLGPRLRALSSSELSLSALVRDSSRAVPRGAESKTGRRVPSSRGCGRHAAAPSHRATQRRKQRGRRSAAGQENDPEKKKPAGRAMRVFSLLRGEAFPKVIESYGKSAPPSLWETLRSASPCLACIFIQYACTPTAGTRRRMQNLPLSAAVQMAPREPEEVALRR